MSHSRIDRLPWLGLKALLDRLNPIQSYRLRLICATALVSYHHHSTSGTSMPLPFLDRQIRHELPPHPVEQIVAENKKLSIITYS